jgi:hypothetical protein
MKKMVVLLMWRVHDDRVHARHLIIILMDSSISDLDLVRQMAVLDNYNVGPIFGTSWRPPRVTD